MRSKQIKDQGIAPNTTKSYRQNTRNPPEQKVHKKQSRVFDSTKTNESTSDCLHANDTTALNSGYLHLQMTHALLTVSFACKLEGLSSQAPRKGYWRLCAKKDFGAP